MVTTRAFAVGLVACGVMTSSCASSARDALVDAYDNEAVASGDDEECRVDARILATASDAYVADNGVEPTSMADFVPEYLDEESEDWSFQPGNPASFTPVVGGRCEGVDIDRSSAQAVDQTVGQNVIDRIDEAGDATCSTDRKQVETALEIHYQLNGYDATAMGELKQFGVENESNRWALEIPVDGESTVPSVVPVVGGPCDI